MLQLEPKRMKSTLTSFEFGGSAKFGRLQIIPNRRLLEKKPLAKQTHYLSSQVAQLLSRKPSPQLPLS